MYSCELDRGLHGKGNLKQDLSEGFKCKLKRAIQKRKSLSTLISGSQHVHLIVTEYRIRIFFLGNGKMYSVGGLGRRCGNKGIGERTEAQGQRNLGKPGLTKLTGMSLLLEFSKLLEG